jgi:hypothetical protein
MIAARIARRQERTSERDLIGSLLFWKLDWWEAHPLICFAGLVMTILLSAALEQLP